MSVETIKSLFKELWIPYAKVTSQAEKIRDLLHAQGETIVNDHVAFRSFDLGPYPIQTLAQPFLELGYKATGRYDFKQKKLDAISFSHPSHEVPRVFISQLRVKELPDQAQAILKTLIAQIPGAQTQAAIRSELSWPPIEKASYLELAKVSEYAAWLSVFGLRVNHFTVSVNALKRFPELESLNSFLQAQGFRLNGAPDHSIKGNPQCGLAQSSTVADTIPWSFPDGELDLPSCYYEFAKRFVKAGESELFDGFVTQSADKIFESTDRKHHSA